MGFGCCYQILMFRLDKHYQEIQFHFQRQYLHLQLVYSCYELLIFFINIIFLNSYYQVNINSMNIILIFTYGISLKNWEESGLLSEKSNYMKNYIKNINISLHF